MKTSACGLTCVLWRIIILVSHKNSHGILVPKICDNKRIFMKTKNSIG